MAQVVRPHPSTAQYKGLAILQGLPVLHQCPGIGSKGIQPVVTTAGASESFIERILLCTGRAQHPGQVAKSQAIKIFLAAGIGRGIPSRGQ